MISIETLEINRALTRMFKGVVEGVEKELVVEERWGVKGMEVKVEGFIPVKLTCLRK